jgi:hypothetical protein
MGWRTNQPPLWRVLLEKLIFVQLVKKFPSFYGTRRFITMFTRARHWSLSWVRWIQSTSSHPVSIYILIPSSHLRLGLQSCLFPSCLPTETLYAFFIPPACHMSACFIKLWSCHIMNSSPAFRCLLLLMSKYCPQHPVLKDPQSVFSVVCETKFYTHTKHANGFGRRRLWVFRGGNAWPGKALMLLTTHF